MDEKKQKTDDLPHRNDEEIERHARESRKQLDSVPEPGTDPLHEGP